MNSIPSPSPGSPWDETPKDDTGFRFLLRRWGRGWEVIGRGVVFAIFAGMTTAPFKLFEYWLNPPPNKLTTGAVVLAVCGILYLPFALYWAAKAAGWKWLSTAPLRTSKDPEERARIQGAG